MHEVVHPYFCNFLMLFSYSPHWISGLWVFVISSCFPIQSYSQVFELKGRRKGLLAFPSPIALNSLSKSPHNYQPLHFLIVSLMYIQHWSSQLTRNSVTIISGDEGRVWNDTQDSDSIPWAPKPWLLWEFLQPKSRLGSLNSSQAISLVCTI